MHKYNLVHRDIKPEHLLFKNSKDLNSLKIIDLGMLMI